MANNENLKNGEKHRFTTETASLAGKKSVEAKKQKKEAHKTLSNLAKIIAESPTSGKTKEQLKKLGIEDEDATNNAAVVAGVLKAAINGNIKAVEKWEQFTETSAQDTGIYELPARVVTKGFVDINRQIEPNKTYVFEGGRGGGKSSFIAFKIVELIKNRPQLHACITRQVAGTLKDSVYAKMKWAINELGLTAEFDFRVSPLEIVYKKTGQTIYFRGLDDEIKLKSITPPFGYIGILWKEEKDQMKGEAQERSVNQSVLRGGNESYDFSSYNPPKSAQSWVNRAKLVPDVNRIIHVSNYKDVPPEWLGQKFIDDAERLKEINPAAYDHEYMGIANGEGGNVFEYLEIRDFQRLFCV